MKIAVINSVQYGSTGTIARKIAQQARERGHEVEVYVPGGRHNKEGAADVTIFGNRLSEDSHIVLSKITGLNGCYSIIATQKLISRIERFSPDIIHLHNLHNSYICLPLLFRYIKKRNIQVIWTLHDCWAFTGHCPYFTMVDCNRWKAGCHNCPSYHAYPSCIYDNSKLMWKLKKKWFTGVENLTIVTPSQWLANLVKQSFLKEYPVKVIHNGIDLSIFKPTPSNFREIHQIGSDKKILLGVAFGWGIRKGLDIFIELARRLNEEKYQIVLVGTDEQVDKQLPINIISIHRTQNKTELAEIYTASDLFIIPTREDNYPTVNMEAIACGTPVLTFRTGGSPEMIDDKTGIVVDTENIDSLVREIERICNEMPYTQEDCLRRATQFEAQRCFIEYLDLMEDMNKQRKTS